MRELIWKLDERKAQFIFNAIASVPLNLTDSNFRGELLNDLQAQSQENKEGEDDAN